MSPSRRDAQPSEADVPEGHTEDSPSAYQTQVPPSGPFPATGEEGVTDDIHAADETPTGVAQRQRETPEQQGAKTALTQDQEASARSQADSPTATAPAEAERRSAAAEASDAT